VQGPARVLARDCQNVQRGRRQGWVYSLMPKCTGAVCYVGEHGAPAAAGYDQEANSPLPRRCKIAPERF
jgi:hypothetical protein